MATLNCAAKCIRDRPAAAAKSSSRSGSEICRSMNSWTRFRRQKGRALIAVVFSAGLFGRPTFDRPANGDCNGRFMAVLWQVETRHLATQAGDLFRLQAASVLSPEWPAACIPRHLGAPVSRLAMSVSCRKRLLPHCSQGLRQGSVKQIRAGDEGRAFAAGSAGANIASRGNEAGPSEFDPTGSIRNTLSRSHGAVTRSLKPSTQWSSLFGNACAATAARWTRKRRTIANVRMGNTCRAAANSFWWSIQGKKCQWPKMAFSHCRATRRAVAFGEWACSRVKNFRPLARLRYSSEAPDPTMTVSKNGRLPSKRRITKGRTRPARTESSLSKDELLDRALDEALAESFPASDPPAVG